MSGILSIFLLFCYYGCLCFGGGNALTPIYIEDLVNARGWMTLQEFGNLTAIAQMTPGPIGVNAATFFGYLRGGVAGGAAATVGLLLPSYFLMILALRSLKKWENSRIVRGIMAGMRPATIGMILASLVIYLGMSVFSEQIPWEIFTGAPVPEAFRLRPGALAILAASAVLLYRTRISIMAVIFLSAAVGAFCCR